MRHTYQELFMKKFAIGFLALVSVSAMAADRVAKFDKNGDSKVDFTELSVACEVSKSLYERADKNGDGVLSNSELQAAHRYLLDRCYKEEKNA
jgi:hypothetical protein